MPKSRLTKTVADQAEPLAKLYTINDTVIPGFMLKVTPTGTKTFIYQYRLLGGRKNTTRTLTIGRFGPVTVDQARDRARGHQLAVHSGRDPGQEKIEIRNELTVSELCVDYLKYGTGTKKASTLETDRGRITWHIKPLLGDKRVSQVTRPHVERFMQDVADGRTATNARTRQRGRARVSGGKGTASRTVGLLGGIFSYAVKLGLIEKNPVHGVERFKDKRHERYLTDDEIGALGRALNAAEASCRDRRGTTIIRLLLLTGARKGEIEKLRWSEVDFRTGYLRLQDSKTGQKLIHLNDDAIEIVRAIPRAEDGQWVFPAFGVDKAFAGMPKVWNEVRASAGLSGVRLHDLRHTFASVAISNGVSLGVIGGLLGHRDTSTTKRYAHLSETAMKLGSEQVSKRLAAALTGSGVK